MSSTYSDAVAALYRAPQETFVAERKRLAAELKAAGDKTGAAQLSKLTRPPLSAWAVNQLWWQARPAFEELFASSERLRRGDRSAGSAHQSALAALRTRAGSVLSEAGHAVNDATLRRVTTTLSALAATGSFDPDPPGALAADRDPPGFEAWGGLGTRAAEPAPETPQAAAPPPADDATREAQAAQRDAERQAREQRLQEQLERERQEREQREVERTQIQTALATAQAQLAECRATVQRLDAEIALARQGADRARNTVADLEQRLKKLEVGEGLSG